MKLSLQPFYRAFTLIELLVVVAIIAILSAIAVPNFMEAQARSKVSRAKADIRSLATAVEAYTVDYDGYPLVTDSNGRPIFPYPTAGPSPFQTCVPLLITTPVKYISSRLKDPFQNKKSMNTKLFGYGTRAYAKALRGDTGNLQYEHYCMLMQTSRSTTTYFMTSSGPDLDRDGYDTGNPALYDPTNGVLSNGDVAYFGPGVGMKD